MQFSKFRKKLKTLHITGILICYLLSYSSMFCLWLSFLLLAFFFSFQCIYALFVNKTFRSMVKNLILMIVIAVLTFLAIRLSNKLPKNINGFISGIFFMLGNIILVKLYILERHKLLRKHRISEYNKNINTVSGNKLVKNNDSSIVWEEWKD